MNEELFLAILAQNAYDAVAGNYANLILNNLALPDLVARLVAGDFVSTVTQTGGALAAALTLAQRDDLASDIYGGVTPWAPSNAGIKAFSLEGELLGVLNRQGRAPA